MEDLEAPDICPVLGLTLNYSAGGYRGDDSASLDCINPLKGYVKGNIRTISWRANRLKSDATLEELLKIAQYIANHLENSHG